MVKAVINIMFGEYTLKIIAILLFSEGSLKIWVFTEMTLNVIIKANGRASLERFHGVSKEIFSLEASLDT